MPCDPRRSWTATPPPVSARRRRRRTTSASASPTPGCSRSTPGGGWSRPSCGRARTSPGRYARSGRPPGLRGRDRPLPRRLAGRARATRRTCWSPTARSTRSTWSAGCCSSPATSWPSRSPGYPPAATLFASFGARVAPVPVDEEGLVVDALPARARLVYATPSHQFPTGARDVAAAAASALLEWAAGSTARGRRGRLRQRVPFLVNGRWSRWSASTRSGRVLLRRHRSPRRMLPALRVGLRRGAAVAAVGAAGRAPAVRRVRRRSRPRRRWPGSSTRGCSPGTYARRPECMRRGTPPCSPPSSRSPGLELVPSSAGLHVCARLPAARPGDGRRVVAAARRRRGHGRVAGRLLPRRAGLDVDGAARGRAWWWGTAPWPTTGWTRGCVGWSRVLRRETAVS